VRQFQVGVFGFAVDVADSQKSGVDLSDGAEHGAHSSR
jgi:hypothetical protein